MLLRLPKYYTIQFKPEKDMILVERWSRFPSWKENHTIAPHVQANYIHLSSSSIWGSFERPRLQYTLLLHHQWLSLKVPCNSLHSPMVLGSLIQTTYWQWTPPKRQLALHPPKLHDRYLTDLHQNHITIEKVQQSQWSSIYWPNIDADINDYVKHCSTYIQQKKSHTTKPLMTRDIPDGL